MKLVSLESIPVSIDERSFYMSSAVFSADSSVSEIPLVTAQVSRTITAHQPCAITLEGKILPCDKEFFKALISDCSGKALSSVTIDGTEYSDMVMVKGSCSFSDKSFVGKCVLVLKKL